MHVYEVLKRPVVTEKTMYELHGQRKYVFEVDMRANKMLVKDAVQTAFGVTVENVNMLVMPAKTARRGRRISIRKPKWKKAVVTLVPGDSIQIFEGV